MPTIVARLYMPDGHAAGCCGVADRWEQPNDLQPEEEEEEEEEHDVGPHDLDFHSGLLSLENR